MALLSDYIGGIARGPAGAQIANPNPVQPSAPPGPTDLSQASSAAGTARTLANATSKLLGNGEVGSGLRTADSILAILQGGAKVANAITDDSQNPTRRTLAGLGGAATALGGASRIPTMATAVPGLGAIGGGVDIGTNAVGGAANVPYLDMAAGAFNVANIASSDLPDDQKAYDALHQVGRVVANAYLPVAGGFLADAVSGGIRSLIFDDPYSETRRKDAGKIPTAMRALLASIDSATTLDELNEAASINAAGASGEVGGRGVALRGVHLDTSGQETALSDAYNARKALIDAASANPTGPEARKLAGLKGQYGPLRAAADVVSRALGGGYSPHEILVSSFVPGVLRAPNYESDLGVIVLDQLDRNLAESQGQASQIKATRDLLNASQVLKLDLDAASRLRNLLRISVGAGDVGIGDGSDGGSGDGGAGDGGVGGPGGGGDAE